MTTAQAPAWSGLPTGYFTHGRIYDPNPLANAPESPERMEALESRLFVSGLEDFVERVECGPAPRGVVTLAHDEDYVEALEKASQGDKEALARFEMTDTKVGPGTFDAAMRSVGAVVAAVDAVFSRTCRNAFCAVRPPGHHAGRARAGGFCFLNNVAVGALYARARWGVERVAVLDFDVHHGDGTEEILAGREGVRFLSLFQWPLFPDRCIVPAPENVVQSPLEAGAAGPEIERVVENEWLPVLADFRPQLMLLSAGFDAHVEETMAQLRAAERDYAYLTRRMMDAAAALCEGRLVSVLEGGYSLRSLARSVTAHLQTLVRP